MEQVTETEQEREEFDFENVFRHDEGIIDCSMVAGLKRLDGVTNAYIRRHMVVKPLGRIEHKEVQSELATIAKDMKYTTKPKYTFDAARLALVITSLSKAKFFSGSLVLFYHREIQTPVLVTDNYNLLVFAPIVDE
jgi:hypothetical protein